MLPSPSRSLSPATFNSQSVICLSLDRGRSDGLLVTLNRQTGTAPEVTGLPLKMPRSLCINTDTFVGDVVRAFIASAAMV